jgi:competence protein ComEA
MKSLYFALFFILFFAVSAFSQININTAATEQLTSLKGIGPVKAEAIVRYRTDNGLFQSIDEIKNVPGIGEKIFAQIKDEIIVEAPKETRLEVVHQEAAAAKEESAVAEDEQKE